jgi:hypothetical protein
VDVTVVLPSQQAEEASAIPNVGLESKQSVVVFSGMEVNVG